MEAKKPRKKQNRKLNQNQERFCLEYSVDGNGVRSYRAAYPNCKSDYAAGREAARLLKDTRVQARLAQVNKKIEQRAEKTADEIVAEMERIGFSRVDEAVDEEGQIKPFSEMSDRARAAIKSITTTTNRKGQTKTKISFYDKLGALGKLGDRYGLFPSRSIPESQQDDMRPIKIVLDAGAGEGADKT